jgi:hypothetical protein
MKRKTFNDLNIGDKIYVINHESYFFEPMVGTITKVTIIKVGKSVDMEIETDTLGTICPEIQSLNETTSWQSDCCWDIFVNKKDLEDILLNKIKSLSEFCLENL